MKTATLILAAAVVLFVDFANADCCYYWWLCPVDHKMEKRCADCTTFDHYCGAGPAGCNMFGCACDGGCRLFTPGSWCDQQCAKAVTTGEEYILTLMGQFDQNENRALDREEFAAFVSQFASSLNETMEFAKLDTDHNGRITLAEIDPEIFPEN